MPNSTYADPGGQIPELGNFLKQADPQAGFFSFLRQLGTKGLDDPSYNENRRQYVTSRYAPYYGSYLSVAADDPNMSFYDFLMKSGVNPNTEWLQQSPEARGDFGSRFYAPRARWVTS